MAREMQRTFRNRGELIAYLAAEFPDAAAVSPLVPDTRGGGAAAQAALAQITPQQYAASRNFLTGAVTRLSPYIRHGVLSLVEVRAAALRAVGHADEAAKLIQELGWHDYWQRVYAAIGDGIWQDREPATSGEPPASYAHELPPAISEGRTDLACMDAFRHELVATGYLHNHARMWLAAYLVHWQRVAWQTGARWFLQHLLDGDPASNNLSWQWVAGTFSSKPYIFNRANLERYTAGVYCRSCVMREQCPFDASYEELTARLFPQLSAQTQPPRRRR
jgi:deoxyribodipyrimidine photo-lyase